MSSYYPYFDNAVLDDKEKVYGNIPFKKEYSATNYRHLLSSLLKIVESFLIQRHFEQEKFQEEKLKLLIEIYSERNHEDFEQAIRNIIKNLEKSSVISTQKSFDY